ncbi:MAG: tetratricopeptide repeat protein [bacterium]
MKSPNLCENMPESYEVAIMFIDLVDHAEKTKECEDKVLQCLLFMLKHLMIDMINETRGNQSFNFTGDGALIGFSQPEYALEFCLSFRQKWPDLLSSIQNKYKEIRYPKDLEFRAVLHWGTAFPIQYYTGDRQDHVSRDIIMASRILAKVNGPDVVVTDEFVSALGSDYFRLMPTSNYKLKGDRKNKRKVFRLVGGGEKEASLWYELGLAYARRGQHEKEIHAYKKALRIKPSLASALFNLARANYDLCKYCKAIELFDRLIVDPTYRTASLYYRGRAKYEIGDRLEENDEKRNEYFCRAIEDFESALELDRSYIEARELKEFVKSKMNNHQKSAAINSFDSEFDHAEDFYA